MPDATNLQRFKAKGMGISPSVYSKPRYLVLPEYANVMRATEQGRAILRESVNGAQYIMPSDPSSAGFTGLPTAVGHVLREYHPDLANLQSRMTVYNEMRRSEHAVGISELLITNLIAMTDFHVLPGDDMDLAELLEWNIHDGMAQYQTGTPPRPFSHAIREACLAFFEGFGWHYQKFGPMTTGGKSFTGWHELAPRLPGTVWQWDFDEEGHVVGLVQYGQDPRTMEHRYVYYHRDEILLWTWCGDGGDPEGLGQLRRAYRSYRQKDDYQAAANIRIGRQASGVPYAVAPEGEEITSTNADAVLQFMRDITTAHDSGGVLPWGWELKTFDIGNADVPFAEHIQRQTEGIHDVFGTGFVVMAQGGSSGSNALSRDSSAWFGEVILECIADWICEVFNADAIPDFAKRNGSTAERLPRLEHGKVAVRDLERYTRALKVWHKEQPGGVPPDLANEWRNEMGVRPADAVGEVQDAPPPGAIIVPPEKSAGGAQPALPGVTEGLVTEPQ